MRHHRQLRPHCAKSPNTHQSPIHPLNPIPPISSNPSDSTITPAPLAVFSQDANNNLAHLAQLSLISREENKTEQMKKEVKINTTGKRWYVSYYITGIDGKRQRIREYGYVNKEKDINKRMQMILHLQQSIQNKLNNEIAIPEQYGKSISIFRLASDYVAGKSYLKHNSTRTISKSIQHFKDFLLKHNLELRGPEQITTSDIMHFRNYRIAHKVSNRTVNNNLDDVRTMFNYFMQSGINIYKNPCNAIKKLPARSEKNVAYTNEQVQTIFDDLKHTDPFLLYYIKFVSFIFLRCEEVRTLQIKHLDIPGRAIILTAEHNKTNSRTLKLIPEIILSDIIAMNYQNYPPDFYIFGLGGKPAPKPVNNEYFSKKFNPHKKRFALSKLHTIYGFRHTFVSQLLTAGKNQLDIMKLTGHKTFQAFQHYARSVMQLPPNDLSDGFKIKL